MLGQLNFEGKNKIDVAIDRIKHFEPSEGYYLAFSGGEGQHSLQRTFKHGRGKI